MGRRPSDQRPSTKKQEQHPSKTAVVLLCRPTLEESQGPQGKPARKDFAIGTLWHQQENITSINEERMRETRYQLQYSWVHTVCAHKHMHVLAHKHMQIKILNQIKSHKLIPTPSGWLSQQQTGHRVRSYTPELTDKSTEPTVHSALQDRHSQQPVEMALK